MNIKVSLEISDCGFLAALWAIIHWFELASSESWYSLLKQPFKKKKFKNIYVKPMYGFLTTCVCVCVRGKFLHVNSDKPIW